MVIFCLTMALTLVACGGAKEKEYKFGMGVVTSLESSKTGTAQVDATVAAVVTDAEGKIVACRIDVAQNKTAIVVIIQHFCTFYPDYFRFHPKSNFHTQIMDKVRCFS